MSARGLGRKGPLFFVMMMMMAGLWPLIVYGGPSYISDSSSYYRGGEVAWERVSQLVWPKSAPEVSVGGAAAQAGDPASKAVGVRSLVYSAAAFILAWPGTSMLLFMVAQTLVAALLMWWVLRATGATGWWPVAGVPLLLALASSFPVFATLATPDLWAGLLVLCLLLLTVFWDQLHKLERLFASAVLAFAVASHASHILLAIAALGVLATLALVRRLIRPAWLSSLSLARPAAALAAGLAISFASGLVAFGEASPVPKRYPYALARAIEDGPAKWYLEENCPRLHYAVCELFPAGIPSGVGDFLWAENGIAQRATPEQMERIRNEEPEILSRAFAAYPWFQLQASTRNVARQVAQITISPAVYQGRYLDPTGHMQTHPTRPTSLGWHEWVQGVAVIVSLIVFALCWRGLSTPLRLAVTATVFLVITNDLICAILSAPDTRYQTRMLWVAPVLAVICVSVRQRTGSRRVPT